MATLPVTPLKDKKPATFLPKPILNKLPEMSDDQYAKYLKRINDWYGVYGGKKKAVLQKGKYLYHATGAANVGAIQTYGLMPRDPSWKKYDKKEKVPRYDASKDGYLSMAIKQSGAGAMGGKSVLLRMQIGDDIGDWDFRVYSQTEVRTLKTIPADRLQLSKDGGKNWGALSAG